jgi:hypothetical protein
MYGIEIVLSVLVRVDVDEPSGPWISQIFRRSGRPELCLSACHKEYHAANQRHGAKDGRQRNVVCLFASRVNWSDVDDLFPGRIRKPTPRKTEQAKHYQNDAKRFVHGCLLWRRLPEQRGNPPQAKGFQRSG